MKAPLLFGFLVLLTRIGGNLVLVNRTVAALEQRARRLTDLQVVRLEIDAAVLMSTDEQILRHA